MAPADVSSQQMLAQAAQKLSEVVGSASDPPGEFATTLLELLEVTSKINQFEDMNSLAAGEASSEEAKKWRDISMMTTQFMVTQLSDQQKSLVQKLQDLSQAGGSLVKAPATEVAMKPEPKAVTPSAPQVKPKPTAVKPPPGLPAAPPGLSAPPGLAPPPGLASANTGRGRTAGPADVEYTQVKVDKKDAPWNIKKQASAQAKKEAEEGWTVKKVTKAAPWKADSKKQPAAAAPAPVASTSSVFLNFDAYDSD